MKQTFRTLFVCMAMAMLGTTAANAQFGNILKKAKQTLEAVTGTEQNTSTTTTPAVGSVAIPSGGTMQNPFASAVDIELVGAYGKSTSENYGTVYLVMKVKMLANEKRIGLGGTMNGEKTMAVDQDGNSYITGTMGQFYKDVTEGIAVKVTLDDKYGEFADVKKTAKVMQVIKLGCYINAANRGMITFKDVPVLWDVTPQ